MFFSRKRLLWRSSESTGAEERQGWVPIGWTERAGCAGTEVPHCERSRRTIIAGFAAAAASIVGGFRPVLPEAAARTCQQHKHDCVRRCRKHLRRERRRRKKHKQPGDLNLNFNFFKRTCADKCARDCP